MRGRVVLEWACLHVSLLTSLNWELQPRVRETIALASCTDGIEVLPIAEQADRIEVA